MRMQWVPGLLSPSPPLLEGLGTRLDSKVHQFTTRIIIEYFDIGLIVVCQCYDKITIVWGKPRSSPLKFLNLHIKPLQ